MKSLTRTLLAAALLSATAFTPLALAPTAAHAQAAAPAAATKIAVINIQAIMRDSTAAKSVRTQLEAKQKSYQADIQKKEEALQKEDQELAKQRTALAKDAFEQKVKAFRDKATALQKEVQQKKATFDNAFENSLGQIQKTVVDIVAEMAKEKGFSVAIPSSQLLFAEPSLDITQEVLSRLNQKLAKVDVKFEAPAKK